MADCLSLAHKEEAMRVTLTAVAACAVLVLAAAPAEATYTKKKYKKVYKPAYYSHSYRDVHPSGSNPTEPSSWRVGSIEWWRAMNYQGRAGRRF
jgi:transcriptional regulator of nitric oxide reductase